MTRIQGPFTPLRPRSTGETSPASAAEKPSAARETGFSGASAFKASGLVAQGFGTAPSGAVKLSPNDLGVLAQNQGNTNACGTTSLANVMTHWGMPRTHEQIDKSIRPFDLFTAPDKLVSYARDNGMRAELKADASLDDIARMVDQGAPPIVLIDPGNEKDANLHYVTVTGYKRDANGKISDLIIADSAGGRRYSMPAGDFKEKWDNLKLGGIGTGLNNVMITAVPNDGRPGVGGDGVSRKASELQLPKTGFWGNLKSGFARVVANAISSGAGLAQKVKNFFKGLFD